jgi:tRNA (uracil-5-)-methyltransferase TRM9
MQAPIIEKIESINQEFYQKFARSFAATRQHVQPGVSRLLGDLPRFGNWLDIGCGNGNLAVALAKKVRRGYYLGLDSSRELLKEAEYNVNRTLHLPEMKLEFQFADITDPEWMCILPSIIWDGAMLFAVLHHIPGSQQRQQLCKQIRTLLPPGNLLYLSVWQLKHSQRLMARIKPWDQFGIQPGDVEEGDVLMDWRAKVFGDTKDEAFRYVHIFEEEELHVLAEEAKFTVFDSFYSDGKEGNLGLYQIWR